MAVCQAAATVAKLSTARRSGTTSTPPRVLGRHSGEGARGAQVEESAAQQRQERGALRSDRAHHSHGQRTVATCARLQSAWHVPDTSRDKSALLGAREHVPLVDIRILTRGSYQKYVIHLTFVSFQAVKKHEDTIVSALKNERDVSVRQRAVDLLYAMCDKSNAHNIVHEMLVYLETADYSIREEMVYSNGRLFLYFFTYTLQVLKVAILAEKYAQDYTWYVDVILNLIRVAGDYVSEEVWYRVIQIVVNRQDVQGYAAKMVFEALQVK